MTRIESFQEERLGEGDDSWGSVPRSLRTPQVLYISCNCHAQRSLWVQVFQSQGALQVSASDYTTEEEGGMGKLTQVLGAGVPKGPWLGSLPGRGGGGAKAGLQPPDSASRSSGCPVKFEFQIQMTYCFCMSMSHAIFGTYLYRKNDSLFI